MNGQSCRIDADGQRSLLSVLRDDLDFTGTKYGCGEGQCGACTVWIDKVPTRACLTPIAAVGSKAVTTIEGLKRDGQLHPVQQAFLEADALQCGYCTSGMIMTAAALLRANPSPSDADIIAAMNGNVCRCGVYQRIIAAIKKAGMAMKEQQT